MVSVTRLYGFMTPTVQHFLMLFPVKFSASQSSRLSCHLSLNDCHLMRRYQITHTVLEPWLQTVSFSPNCIYWESNVILGARSVSTQTNPQTELHNKYPAVSPECACLWVLKWKMWLYRTWVTVHFEALVLRNRPKVHSVHRKWYMAQYASHEKQVLSFPRESANFFIVLLHK